MMGRSKIMFRERVFPGNAVAIQRSVGEGGHGLAGLESPGEPVWLECEAGGTGKDSRERPEAIIVNNLRETKIV